MSKIQQLYGSSFDSLADVALSGDFSHLTSLPPIAYSQPSDFATAAQGARSDNAEQLSSKGIPGGYAGLDSGGKVLVSQLPNSVMELKGDWDASANSPALIDGVGHPGDVWVVTTAGIQNLGSGSITFALGDFVVYGASGVWFLSLNSNSVVSVNGKTGTVALTTDDVAEGISHLYHTDSRAAAVAPVQSVNGLTGIISLSKSDIGLGNVNNTSDANKPVSTAQQTAINAKADASSLASVATSGVYADLTGKPTLGTASTHPSTDFATSTQGSKADTAVQSVNGHTGTSVTVTKSDVGLANVDNTSDVSKPVSTAQQTALNLKVNTSSLATVATSGSYADLSNKPSIPRVMSISFGGGASDYVDATAASFVTIASFIFPGSTYFGTVSAIKAIVSLQTASTTGAIQLIDVTNAKTIATFTGFTNTAIAIQDLGVVSNIPTGEALFQIQVQRTVGASGQVRVHGISLKG